MKVSIYTVQTSLRDTSKDYIRNRAAFAFSRLEPFVSEVHITLEEVTAPVGGKDKECRISIVRNDQSEFILVEKQATMRFAVDRALFRASYNLQRKIRRSQMLGYGPRGAA